MRVAYIIAMIMDAVSIFVRLVNFYRNLGSRQVIPVQWFLSWAKHETYEDQAVRS